MANQYDGGSFRQLLDIARQAQQLLTQINESPAMQAARQVHAQMNRASYQLQQISQGIRDLQPDWLIVAQRNYNFFQESYNALIADFVNSPTAQAIQQALEVYRSLKTSPSVDALEQLIEQIELMRASGTLDPSLESISTGLVQAYASPEYRSYFEDSFAGDLLERLSEVETAPSPAEKIRVLSDLLAWLRQKINEYPPSRVASIFLMYMIFNIIIPQAISEFRDAPAAQQHSDETDQRFDELGREMEELRNGIAMYQATVTALPQDGPQYIATKSVVVRDAPTARGRVLSRLPEHAVIEEIDRQGNWLYVEYVNYISGEAERGWVYKRNVVTVEPFDE